MDADVGWNVELTEKPGRVFGTEASPSTHNGPRKDQRPLTRDVDRVFRWRMMLIGGVKLAVVSLISNISGNLVCRHADPFLEKFLPDVDGVKLWNEE